jgi:hypothetical protein
MSCASVAYHLNREFTGILSAIETERRHKLLVVDQDELILRRAEYMGQLRKSDVFITLTFDLYYPRVLISDLCEQCL